MFRAFSSLKNAAGEFDGAWRQRTGAIRCIRVPDPGAPEHSGAPLKLAAYDPQHG